MKIAIMQPYFLPYIGYWQLLNAVDIYVVYDNIKYTKKGWINRNRILKSGKVEYITIPLEKASDFLYISQRKLSSTYGKNKLLNQVVEAYRKAPYFNHAIGLFDEIISYNDDNLFNYLYNSIKLVADYLEISTEIIVSSRIDIDHNLKGKDKIISICNKLRSNIYINSIGGVELYKKNEFISHGIELYFLASNELKYQQYADQFFPNLSILDMIMFVERQTIIKSLREYKLI